MTLSEYLQTRPVAGPAACGLFISGWVKAKRGVDPLPRGKWMTADDVQRVFDGYGGLALAVARHLRKAGLRMTREPKAGDVGLVVVGARVCCAIRTQAGWMIRLEDGAVWWGRDPVGRVLAAWSV